MDSSKGKAKYAVVTMYRFVALDCCHGLADDLHRFCVERDIKGTFLLSGEGINGTVAGRLEKISELLEFFSKQPSLASMQAQLSYADEMPFYRMKVKLKKEIVTMGRSDICLETHRALSVSPQDWNSLISQSEVLLLDVRNHYEYQIGSFIKATATNTGNFRAFPDYVNQNLDHQKDKKIALFCTGGIRCEKAGSYLLQQGFEQVYQLQGGILNYLKQIDRQDSLWRGECFVFDQRVAVNHDLESGAYAQCFACRHPLTDQEVCSDDYQKGISCPYCIEESTHAQKDRFKQRQYQIELADERGQQHIGCSL